MGKIATLGASLLHGNRSTRLSRKIGPKYQILLHLSLQEKGFRMLRKNFDPLQKGEEKSFGKGMGRAKTLGKEPLDKGQFHKTASLQMFEEKRCLPALSY